MIRGFLRRIFLMEEQEVVKPKYELESDKPYILYYWSGEPMDAWYTMPLRDVTWITKGAVVTSLEKALEYVDTTLADEIRELETKGYRICALVYKRTYGRDIWFIIVPPDF